MSANGHHTALLRSVAESPGPVTFEDIVRRTRGSVPVAAITPWMECARDSGLLQRTGRRRHSRDGMRGSPEYRLI
jgi:hypothetical protein